MGDVGLEMDDCILRLKGRKHILLSDSLLNLLCLCRGIKWPEGTGFQTSSKGEMRKVGERREFMS